LTSTPVAVAAFTSAAALAAGCGAATEEDANTSPGASGRVVTSARVEIRSEVRDGGVPPVVYMGGGVYDWNQDIGQLELRYESAEDGAEDWKLEVIALPDAIYTSLPGAPWKGYEGKRWLENRDDAHAFGGPLTWVGGYGFLPSDPGEVLNHLRENGDGVELVGSEDVRGVSTAHYRVELGDDAMSVLLGEGNPEVEKGLLTVDVWVDQDAVARRVRMTMPPSESLRMTVEFFDFGVAVDPDRPAKDEVLTQEEFMRLAREQGTECGDAEERERARKQAEAEGWTAYAPLCLIPGKFGEEGAE
jgi:hypothetical protein